MKFVRETEFFVKYFLRPSKGIHKIFEMRKLDQFEKKKKDAGAK
jgi:hypothetical protein